MKSIKYKYPEYIRKLIEDILRECDIDPFTVDESDPKFINIYKLIHTWHIDKVYAKIHPYQPIH